MKIYVKQQLSLDSVFKKLFLNSTAIVLFMQPPKLQISQGICSEYLC